MPNHLIQVVLVGSLYSRNVGSVSRAMANTGAGRLILINPKCEINLEARQGAAGAQTRLLESTVYSNWNDFFSNEPDGCRIAFSARRNTAKDSLSLEERILALYAMSESPTSPDGPLYLIFGPEDSGLNNNDVEFANYICELPVFGEFKSYNLSHAVLLACFIVQSVLNKKSIKIQHSQSTQEKFFYPKESIMTWLETLGFEIGDRRSDAYKVLKKLFLTSASTAKDFRVLEAVINQTIRKLKKT